MTLDNPYRPFLDQIALTTSQLEQLKRQNAQGRIFQPADLQAVLHQARATVGQLAAFLGIDQPDLSDQAVDQAGLAVYDQAMEACMAITRLSLDMARLHGPSYLVGHI
ncbi:hypothetical protein Deba_1452 [Desulfarculus baarsii DSM 2075]|uniref:Uncharacterized protein n=1 Tax=Desulfarculus baarsii (strain ATCC 33931 / DSM 2075 / LMG 7858 / VKM B-1802 / 2st14) TaxID=644282 RepID=E1QGX7_DESB2|nr:hypothetical protein [Desulfarculus baarsii]ADK84820.1 hypothetical protein Deba_1452 [Desulfarculus baarsii DSM 2075]